MAYILVVDDDDIVAEHAANVLIGAGHASGSVSEAESALAVLKRRKPHLILLDQNMPGENGSTFLRQLRASPGFYDVPVIMLTGVQGLRDEDVAYLNGSQDYIRKPFDERMLVRAVNDTLLMRRQRGQDKPPHWAPAGDALPEPKARFL